MLRAVLDVNVIVSGVILTRGAPFEIIQAWRRPRFELVISETILTELIEVLHRPKIRDAYAVSESAIGRLVSLLRSEAFVTPGDVAIEPAARDADDDKVLACALEAKADCIVTGDKDLLSLGSYYGIAILRPAEFLARLEQPAG